MKLKCPDNWFSRKLRVERVEILRKLILRQRLNLMRRRIQRMKTQSESKQMKKKCDNNPRGTEGVYKFPPCKQP